MTAEIRYSCLRGMANVHCKELSVTQCLSPPHSKRENAYCIEGVDAMITSALCLSLNCRGYLQNSDFVEFLMLLFNNV